MTIKTYYKSSGKHVSSSICASVNYFDRLKGPELDALHDRMKSELGEHVIIDGSDDWGANVKHRPENFIMQYNRERLGIQSGPKLLDGVLAYYHSGTSGVTKSGIVVTPETFDALSEWYADKYGDPIDQSGLRLTFHSNSTAL